MKSIQGKILFVVITGLLVITAVVSAIAVTMTHEIMHKDADRILAQLEAAQINDTLGDVVKSCSIMKHYATTEAIKDLNKEIRTGNPKFGVLMADINNLKQTNDKFGHDVGDDLIICTAKILNKVFQSSVIFRIGGDEFAVILLNDDYEQYCTRLKQLDEDCTTACVTVGESTIPVWVARGIARFAPNIDRTYEDVFAKADYAMYINKQESKAAIPQ